MTVDCSCWFYCLLKGLVSFFFYALSTCTFRSYLNVTRHSNPWHHKLLLFNLNRKRKTNLKPTFSLFSAQQNNWRYDLCCSLQIYCAWNNNNDNSVCLSVFSLYAEKNASNQSSFTHTDSNIVLLSLFDSNLQTRRQPSKQSRSFYDASKWMP